MPLYLRKNQYRGVNAHLQSYFQAHGGWGSFHNRHIGFLVDALNDNLPQGYLVDIEQSLQIREIHPDTGEPIRRPQPDVTIYQRESALGASSALSSTPTLVQPVLETMDLSEDLYLAAVLIYEADGSSLLGRPVTRIELLSPTNKQGGDGYIQYVDKRNSALKSGLSLVEIDYLHETVSPIKNIPRYPRQPGSFPFSITVSNPSPNLKEGLSYSYGIAVDHAITIISVPLGHETTFPVDFGAAYDRTFSSMEAYSLRTDYEQLPEHFELYSPADQERIRQVMGRAANEPIV
jgi:hypothetical protein